MNGLEMLLELQQEYNKINEYKRLIKECANIDVLRKLKVEFENGKKQYNSKIKLLKDIKGENALIDEKIMSIKDEMKNNEYKLYNESGSDIKCIEILQHKIEESKLSIKELEDKSIDILEKEETLKNEIKNLRTQLGDMRDDFYETKETKTAKSIKTKEQLIKLENKMNKLKKKIPKEYLEIFMKILDRKGSAVAKLEGGVCCGCKMRISTMTKDNVSKGKELIYCDNCGRILYYK